MTIQLPLNVKARIIQDFQGFHRSKFLQKTRCSISAKTVGARGLLATFSSESGTELEGVFNLNSAHGVSSCRAELNGRVVKWFVAAGKVPGARSINHSWSDDRRLVVLVDDDSRVSAIRMSYFFQNPVRDSYLINQTYSERVNYDCQL